MNQLKFCVSLVLLVLNLMASAAAFGAGQDDAQQTGLNQAQTSTAAEEPSLLPSAAIDVDATVVGYDDYRDPLEFINRPVFAFNDMVLRYALIPASGAYVRVVPSPVRTGIGNVFSNLKQPLRSVNHLLQGRPADSGWSLLSFLTNTTVGIGGIFDPARAWFGIETRPTTLNDTLRHYGVGFGVYIVLPVFGGSDMRSGFSRLIESALSPVRLFSEYPDSTLIISFGEFQLLAPSADAYLRIIQPDQDNYEYFRNQYWQSLQRDQEYRNAPAR